GPQDPTWPRNPRGARDDPRGAWAGVRTAIGTSLLRPGRDATLFPYTTLFRSPRERAPRRPASAAPSARRSPGPRPRTTRTKWVRSEEHTSELQSPYDLVCRLPLAKKNHKTTDLRSRLRDGVSPT